MKAMPAAIVLVVAGCAPQDRPADDAASCGGALYVDADGDGFGNPDQAAPPCSDPYGYAAIAGDCDDTRYGVRPGADELCNDRDDDCDGSVDDDAVDPSVWFLDEDGDGYGTDESTTLACAVAGHSRAGGDCDESNAFVHPDADEVCDDVDNDCDGRTDADDPSLQGGQTWYTDADSDGYGNLLSPMTTCGPPSDGVLDAADCDDGDPEVHPEQTEICDETDNDCDGSTDELDGPSYGADQYWVDADGDGYGTGDVGWSCSAPAGYAGRDGDCDDGDAALGAAAAYYVDGDGDGYGAGTAIVSCAPVPDRVVTPGDCNDRSAAVLPGAVEMCNDYDDNCDGFVDDHDPFVVTLTWYGDDDGDGFGDATVTLDVCEPPSGYVAAAGDCDDGDAGTSPGAIEWCDAIDNDCDGVDDDDPLYVDWYADVDGDGFGDGGTIVNDCVAPSGYALVDGDCDDARAESSPAALETCANDVDDDCDALVDECPQPLDESDVVVQGGSAGDQIAAAMVLGDFDGNGTSDLLLGAPAADAPDGALWIVSGPASGTLSVDDGVRCATGTAGGELGSAVASGDADGDGIGDALVGAPGIDTAFLFLGPITADAHASDVDAELVGDARDVAGDSVAIAGDVDGDGVADVVIGAPEAGAAAKGAVYTVAGITTGTVDLTTDAVYTFEGGSGDSFGSSVADLGDVTGDGIADLAVGADTAGFDGEVMILEGGAASGTYAGIAVATAFLRGPEDSGFGYRLASADYDNDGTADLFVGAPTAWNDAAEPSGAVFAFLGPFSGLLDSSDATARWVTLATHTNLGVAIAVDGDVDGDKQPDVLLGAPSTDLGISGIGSAYLQLGLASGTVDVDTLLAFPAVGDEYGGWSVAFVPDWDGDDGSELAVGAPYAEGPGGAAKAGAAYVILSSSIIP